MKPKYEKTPEKCIYTYWEDGDLYYAYRLKINGVVDTWIRFDSKGKPFVESASLKKEAKRRRLQIERQQEGETKIKVDRDKDDISFAELWKEFKADPDNGKEASTIDRYEKIYKNHIKDYTTVVNGRNYSIASDPIGIIPVLVFNKFLTKKLNETYIPKKDAPPQQYKKTYINAFRKFFVLLLNYGIDGDYISKEKADELFRMESKENKVASDEVLKIRSLTAEQIAKIEELLDENPPMKLAFFTGLLAGARTGEAFAVRFSDFRKEETEEGTHYYLKIRGQMVETKREFHLRKPKTFPREVPIPQKLYDMAMERKAYIDGLKEKDKQIPVPPGFQTPMQKNYVRLVENELNPTEQVIDDFITMADDGRYLFYTGSFKKYATIIRRDICPSEEGYEEFSFYTGRKSYLTKLAVSGLSVYTLAYISGHKKLNTLYEHYYGFNEDAEKAARECLDRAMNEMNLK